MKVLFSTPPGNTTEKWPPLGLLYLAASLKKSRNDDVKVIDAFCMNLTKAELVKLIKKENPDIIGFNTSTHSFLNSIEVLREVSRTIPNMTIVMGGYHPTFASEQILKTYPFVDYVIKGEADIAIVELLECIENGIKPSKVDGISFFDEDHYFTNPSALVKNLDHLPFPDRNLLKNVEYGYNYRNIPLMFGKFTTMSTSRGCPFECSYCSCASFSHRKIRFRSAENVIHEMQMLFEDGFKNVVLVDDNFTHKPERVEEICELIKEEKIRMKFYCEGRVNKSFPNLLKKMKNAGFEVIYFGAESGSKHALDYYNKKITPEQTIKAVENAKRANMIVIASFILGAPVESMEDLKKTINFIWQLKPHGIQINILDILIGTKLWEDMSQRGKIGPEDWKTNHRIYEYWDNGHNREELERLVNQGYKAYFDSWKNKKNIVELIKLLLHNQTARSVIFNNLLNPYIWKTIKKGIRPLNSGKKNL
jgi:anaerobic magnesium-protoporphyrin IX monomethyl ester cyclase